MLPENRMDLDMMIIKIPIKIYIAFFWKPKMAAKITQQQINKSMYSLKIKLPVVWYWNMGAVQFSNDAKNIKISNQKYSSKRKNYMQLVPKEWLSRVLRSQSLNNLIFYWTQNNCILEIRFFLKNFFKICIFISILIEESKFCYFKKIR